MEINVKIFNNNNLIDNQQNVLNGHVEIRNPDTGLIEYSAPMGSWLDNFLKMLYAAMSGVSVNVVDTNNNTRGVSNASGFAVSAPASNSLYGLVVGSGTNPIILSNYKLQTQIPHGTGSGQLVHQAVTFEVPTINGSTISFRIKRILHNTSGSSITVNEIGLYGYSAYNYCIARDLISGGYIIEDGQSREFIYVLSLMHTNTTGMLGNLAKLLFYLFSTSISGYTLLGTNGSQVSYAPTIAFDSNADSGMTSYGLVVGSGDTATNINDFKLNTQIAHGSGNGQLFYFAQNFVPIMLEESGNSEYFYLKRSFRNLSGSNVTIKELGQYVRTNASAYACVLRHLLASPFTVTNGGLYTFTVKYNINL